MATWVRGHVKGLRVGAVAVAVLAFVFMEQPTGVTILVIAALLLVVLAVIEFLARPSITPPADVDGGGIPAGATAAPAPAATVVPPAPRTGEEQDAAPVR